MRPKFIGLLLLGVLVFAASAARAVDVLATSDFPPSAYNNTTKAVISGNDVHITYFEADGQNQRVMYRHSSNAGLTWDTPEPVSDYFQTDSGRYPAIALDAAGRPYILWAGTWYYDYTDHIWRLLFFVSSQDPNGDWDSSSVTAFDASHDEGDRPDFEPPPPTSFCVVGDSGYLAFDYRGNDDLVYPPSAGVYYRAFPILPPYRRDPVQYVTLHSSENNPTVLLDDDGRSIVVSAHNAPPVIEISYKNAGTYPFSSYSYAVQGPVQNIAATVDHDLAVLVAWTTTPGSGPDQVKYARFSRSEQTYQLDGNVEQVPDNIAGAPETSPRFFAHPDGLPALVYECHDATQDHIDCAVRRTDGTWWVDTVFYYNFLGFPQGFCDGRRLHALATGDEWGGAPYYLLIDTISLPIVEPPVCHNSLATYPNSGRKLVVEPAPGIAHLVYDEGDYIIYARSVDSMQTWCEFDSLDIGDFPSVAVNCDVPGSGGGLPTVVYLQGYSILCQMKQANGAWEQMVLYPGDESHVCGPPAAAQSLAAPTHTFCTFRVIDYTTGTSNIMLVRIDPHAMTSQNVASVPGVSIDSFVSLAFSPEDTISLAWRGMFLSGKDRIRCATFAYGQQPFVEQVSDAPASHPFVDAICSRVAVVYRDQGSYEIRKRIRVLGNPGRWQSEVLVAEEADYPACAECDACVYQKPDPAPMTTDDIWASLGAGLHNCSNSPGVNSRHGHIDATYLTASGIRVDITSLYSIWTETIDDTNFQVQCDVWPVTPVPPGGPMADVTPVATWAKLCGAEPNPSRGPATVRYQVPKPTHVTLRICDASGRVLRTLLDSERPAGTYSLPWDGRDQQGRVQPNGVYFCQMKAGDYQTSDKLVVQR